MEWWNGIVECVLQGERSLLMQFFIIVTPLYFICLCSSDPSGELKCVTMALKDQSYTNNLALRSFFP